MIISVISMCVARIAKQRSTHKMTLKWVHNQFATTVHTLFYFLHDQRRLSCYCVTTWSTYNSNMYGLFHVYCMRANNVSLWLWIKIWVCYCWVGGMWRINHIDGLVQERRNSSALAMELRLSRTNPSIYVIYQFTCIFPSLLASNKNM